MIPPLGPPTPRIVRPPQVPSSAYATPLDIILGTPLRVRILRALDEAGDVRHMQELARRTAANPTALRRAIEPLVESGLVEQVGQGRGAVFRVNQAHPFSAALGSVFDIERRRKEAIPETVRAWAEQAKPAPLAVWVYGSVARRDDEFTSDVDLALVAPGPPAWPKGAHELVPIVARRNADAMASQLRAQLEAVAATMRLSPSVVVMLPSEFLALEKANRTLWRGLVTESQPLVGPTAEALAKRLKREKASLAS